MGLLTMLFGAFLVFAPGAGAEHWTDEDTNPGGEDNPSCADLGYDVEAKDNTERNAPYSGTASGGGLIVDYTLNTDGTVDFVVDLDGDEPDSEYAVSAVIIKKGDAASGAGANVYEYDPATLSDEGLQTIPEGATSFSHITFCGGELPDDPCDDIGDYGAECDPCDDIGDVGEDCDPCDDIGDVGEDCDPCDDIGDVGEDCDPCDDIGDVGEDCDPCDDIGDMGEQCEDCDDVGPVGEDCDPCDDIGDVGEDCDPCDDIGDLGEDCEPCDDIGDLGDECEVECPEGTEYEETNGIEGIQAEECTEIEDEETPPVVTCPEGTTHTDVNGDGVVQESECVEVQGAVTPAPKKATPTPAVLGAQTSQALAATGSGSDTLTTVGIALIMFGAVLSMGSRRRVRYLR